MKSKHNVEADSVGLNPRPRLTCIPCRDTLVCQPYMDQAQWNEKAAAFKAEHSNV